MKKLLCFVALVCLLATTARAQGWSELPNTKIRPVCWDSANNTGCVNVVAAWNSAVMDTLRNRLIVWGGGHGDYYGNEIYAINLSGTPTAERLNDPTAGGCSLESCDGGLTPNSRHTYDGIEYMPNSDRMFVFGGALAGNGFAGRDTWTFRFSDKVWQKMNPSGPLPNATCCVTTGYDSNTGKVFLVDLSNLYVYDFAADTYQLLGSASGMVNYHATGVVDPVRRKFVTFGNGEASFYDISGAGSYSRQLLNASGCDAVKGALYPGLAYDTATDRIVAWVGGNAVYSFDFDTRICTPITQYTGGPGAQQANGTYGRWSYSAPLNAFVIVNSIDQNAYLFRLSGGSPPPPPPPPPPPGVLTVGPGKQYATVCAAIAAAPAGGTIEADAGIYPNESCAITQNDLTLRSIGGRAHLKWATGDHTTHTSNIPNGKAILNILGGGVVLENLEFSGAKVADGNGSGVRYSDGGNLTIRNGYFHNNESGLLGQGGLSATLLVEYSIFEANGYCPGGGGCNHNVYIGTMGRLIFQHNTSRDSVEGHTLKSRAHVNEILYNFISTKNSDGSYEIDLPNGGTAYVIGNVVEQGANTGNSSILGWGAEGATNPNPELRVINNTFYNWRPAGATFVQVSGSVALSIKNNIFAGGGVQLVGGATDLASNKTSSAFVNAAAGDFHLLSSSDAINAGVPPGTSGSYDLTPLWEYVEPAARVARTLVGTIDVGAYESNFAPPPPPPSSCVTNPFTPPDVSNWPTSQTGQRQLRWNSGSHPIKKLEFTWPGTVLFTRTDDCTVTVAKP